MEPLWIIILIAIPVLIAGIFYLLKQSKSDKGWKDEVRTKLASIELKFKPDAQVDTLKAVVIDTDKLFDYTLKKKGFKGETMGERLKSAKEYFDKDMYNNIWEAHKLRNNLVHEFNYIPNFNEVKRHYSNFKKGLLSLI
jgi:hypothetical protein